MKIFYCDEFVLPLPEWHRFPMAKYRLLRERILADPRFDSDELVVPPAATPEQLLRAHDPSYVERCLTGTLRAEEVRELGFPWSPQLVERSRRSSGATIEACRAALLGPGRIAVNLAGGTHHASAGKGAGYCMFNDSAVASRAMQAEGLAQRVLVVDCDVHQGDGTASIFANDPSVFTLSIHGEKNYPLHKSAGDLDIPMPDGVGDDDYLAALQAGLDRATSIFQAELAIYLAGADPFMGDTLGRLNLTKSGLAERDRLVLRTLIDLGLPVAITMAGGYSKTVDDIVDIHHATVTIARELA